TDAVAWAQFGGGSLPTAGAGLTLTGSTLAVGQGTGLTVDADTVSINTAVVARHYAAAVGDGSATSIPVAHGLGTKDVTVAVRRVSDDKAVERIRELTGGRGADAVFDFAGVPPTTAIAQQCAGVESDVTIVGIGGG
ncbi:hypothetical protein ADL27_39665, partial [Streptomyces sp. NRRL F-6602]